MMPRPSSPSRQVRKSLDVRAEKPAVAPPSRLAALHALKTGCSLDAAGACFGVSRQAVSQSIRRLATTPRKPGRRPSGKPARRSVTVGAYAVKLSAAERTTCEAAAERAGLPLATWLRGQGERRPRCAGETVSAWLRRAALAGAARS